MNNWLRIFKFTLKQALAGKKFLTSTLVTGIIIFVAVVGSNMLASGSLGDSAKVRDLRAVYIVNNTDLSIDTDEFVQKNNEEYPFVRFSEITGESAEEAAMHPGDYGADAEYSLVLDVSEKDDVTELTVYIPEESSIGSDDSGDFAWKFKDTIKNARIRNTDISEEKMNMSISDIKITEIKAQDEEEDTSVIAALAPMIVMLFLYMLVIIYGQSIGHTVSMEKTSKLMEYILTLTKPAAIIFGKVTAIFCEAVMQLAVWVACGVCGMLISNSYIASMTGGSGKNIITIFMEALPEGGVSDNFTVLLVLAIIAMLAAFLFYCFVSALLASFASTPEELTQTNSMSVMIMLAGFFASMYIPMIFKGSKVGKLVVRLVPFSAAFSLPGDVLTGQIGLIEFVLYLVLLLVFTVLMALLTGRVYKNRLFKKGTKGIFDEILAAITGKATKADEEKNEADAADADKAYKTFENHDSARKAFTIVGFALLVFMLSTNTIGGLVVNVIGKMIAGRKHMDLMALYENMDFMILANIVCLYVIASPLCALVMQLSNDSKQIVRGHISKSQYARSIFMLFPVAILLNYLSTWLAEVLSGGQAENDILGFLMGDNIPAMIMVAVLAPVFEELVFRKLIIDRIRRYGEWTAILYSAIAFGLFHCNLYQVIYAAALGLILGYVYVRTGRVTLTIIMHICVNASSSILAPLAPEVYNVFVIAMLVLGVLSIIYTLIKRDVRLERAVNEVPAKELSHLAFVNAGSIFFALSCLFMTVYRLVI